MPEPPTMAVSKAPHILANGDHLLTPAQVAAMFNVDVKTVSRWGKGGKLPVACVTPGGHRRYAESEVRKFFK